MGALKKKKAPPKRKPAIRKKAQPKKKKHTKSYINGDTWTEKELKRFAAAIKKVRKNKRTRKQKKIGLTNTISLLNMLFNADKERTQRRYPFTYRRRYPPYSYRRKNLMYDHPYKYPSLIPDANVNDIWKATGLKTSGSKDGMISNINNVYHSLYGYQLLRPIQEEAPQQAPKRPIELPSKPSRAPPLKRQSVELPSKPSRVPAQPYIVDDDDQSSSSEDEIQKI